MNEQPGSVLSERQQHVPFHPRIAAPQQQSRRNHGDALDRPQRVTDGTQSSSAKCAALFAANGTCRDTRGGTLPRSALAPRARRSGLREPSRVIDLRRPGSAEFELFVVKLRVRDAMSGHFGTHLLQQADWTTEADGDLRRTHLAHQPLNARAELGCICTTGDLHPIHVTLARQRAQLVPVRRP